MHSMITFHIPKQIGSISKRHIRKKNNKCINVLSRKGLKFMDKQMLQMGLIIRDSESNASMAMQNGQSKEVRLIEF